MKTIKTVSTLVMIAAASDMFIGWSGLKDWVSAAVFCLCMVINVVIEDIEDRKALTKLNSPDCQPNE